LVFVWVSRVVLVVRIIGLIVVRGLIPFLLAAILHVGVVRIFLIRGRNVTLFTTAATALSSFRLGNLHSFLGRRCFGIIPSEATVSRHAFCGRFSSALA